MTDPQTIHMADQSQAAAKHVGHLRGHYYQGARQAGAPRWLAALVTIIDAYGDAIAHAAAADAIAHAAAADAIAHAAAADAIAARELDGGDQ